MDANPQRPKDQDVVASTLNEAAETMNRAEKLTSVAATKAIRTLLTMIRARSLFSCTTCTKLTPN